MAGNAKRSWPVNLRPNRIVEITFPDGIPPGGTACIETIATAKGKAIGVESPAKVRIGYRRRAKK